ncbi:hypothetical protein N2152v2_000249 [Parachlorella kessleri]
METSLGMDSNSKHLNLHFKKKFEHHSDVQLKLRGVLDTVTAQGRFHAGLHKVLRLGKTPLFSPNSVYQPDTRVQLGLGAKATTESDELLFSLGAKKRFVLQERTEIIRNRINLLGYTELVLRAGYDYNPRLERWAGEASVQGTHSIFGFTEGQDLRVSAGYRARFTPTGVTSQEPFLKIRENNWGLQTNFKRGGRKDWLLTYDL